MVRKLWRKCFENFYFPVPVMGRKGTLAANILKSPHPGQRLTSSWRHETVHVNDDGAKFLWWPRMLIRKTAKPCINSSWIALLIHGFVPVKTWLLKACDTAFYAIMLIGSFSDFCCLFVFPFKWNVLHVHMYMLLLLYEPLHDKTNKMNIVPIEDSDQPGHLTSDRVFAVRMKKA